MNFDIDNLSVQEISDKKVIREIFNTYNDDLELDNACNRLIARVKSFNSEELESTVKGYILEFLERRRKKKEVIEEKNRKLKWHLEVRAKKKAEEERKRLKSKKRELDKLELQAREDARKLEYEELKKDFVETLDDEVGKDIVENRLVYKKDGSLDIKSVVNHDLIIQNDKYIKEHIRFNEFTNNLEFDGIMFTNSDLLNINSYLDRRYKLRDSNLIWNALNRPGNVERYHPIKDIIEDEEWDKESRIDKFFENICHVVIKDENTRIYYREVARMLFYGGIKRLYEPGCKFDYMIILKGKQGTCKTTLVRLLALDDSAYSEVTTIDGASGIENIKGSWICEFAELLAMVRAREVEGIKAFLTRQYDKYRAPYAHVAETVPRSCIFIGTTNEIQFMGDMTGNRRYLPVEVHTDATEFFENIEYVKSYILECWREAFYKYINGEIYTTIPAEYFDILEDIRSYYVDDNPLEGLVKGYLDTLPVGYDICGLEIFVKCFNGVRNKFTTRDSRTIATIMNKYPNWVRYNERKSFVDQGYGQQRYWKKVSDDK
jgi:predicted P-loop ATPase